MTARRRRGPWLVLGLFVAVAVAGLGIRSWLQGGVMAALLRPGSTAETAALVRGLLAGSGSLAPVVYVGLVVVEVVVAPLPGILLYAPGGVLFGGLQGGGLALVGNVLGAALAFAIARRLGRARARAWFREGHLEEVERRLSDNGLLVVFLLRVNPLTSSDLVSYAAGLTSLPAGKLLAGTALGLAPLCWAQAYVAEGLVASYPWLLYPALGAALLYLLAGVWLVWRTLLAGPPPTVVEKAREEQGSAT